MELRVLFLKYTELSIPTKLRAAMRKVQAAVERDDFASPDIKKLKSKPFFRAKLDDANRLLLQFVQYRERRACLALEVIENHAYDRSRFLRGARVEEAVDLEPEHATLEQLSVASQQVRYLHPSRSEFHLLTEPLSFDDTQHALLSSPLPMVLVGCAGSGKTALTLTRLRELPGDVLYVTQSRYLAESAATVYFSNGYENQDQNVDFLNYARLLDSIEVPAGRPVTLADFRVFFRRHEAQLKFTTAHQLFEELRGVLTADAAGVLSLDGYLALGVRQSIYPQAQRKTVYAFVEKYLTWLKEAGLYDPNIVACTYRSRAEKRYDAVVVDEVQDLTNAELALVLATLKEANQFLLCGDANQIVHPNFFSWSKVKSLFYASEEKAFQAPIHILGVNYRSSRHVCRLANTLLKIKNLRFGSIDKESTALVQPASDDEGQVIGLVKKDAISSELNRRTKGSAKVAVVVLSDEHKSEAKRRFSTPLVFTIHESKGLEYEAVILFDLISSERQRFKEIVEGVSLEDLKSDTLTYARAKHKDDKSLEHYKFFVNALYVGLTRAVKTVYVVESDASHPLLGLLGVACGEDVSGVTTMMSSVSDWQREARRLELQGKQEQADSIRKTILQTRPVPWPVLDRTTLKQTYDKAFMPSSPFTKAKHQLYEFGAFHRLGTLCKALRTSAGYQPTKDMIHTEAYARERAMGHYVRRDMKKVLDEVNQHGIEYRSMMGMTPLMMAADVADANLVEVLLDRGANPEAVDSLGRMPVHFALKRALASAVFARQEFGAMYEQLCPTAIEIEIDGRRLRIARNQGEFFVLLCLGATFHGLYGGMRRYSGFTSKALRPENLEPLPRSIIPEPRRKQAYWNAVLSRAEVESSYRPARKLWRRERVGHYMPSSVKVRVGSVTGESDVFIPLDELLRGGVVHETD